MSSSRMSGSFLALTLTGTWSRKQRLVLDARAGCELSGAARCVEPDLERLGEGDVRALRLLLLARDLGQSLAGLGETAVDLLPPAPWTATPVFPGHVRYGV
jgi:hypothetical protein